jgi:hypothetical protein
MAVPEITCKHWLPALESYERQFSQSRLHIQLLGECVNSFWMVVASALSFHFRQPVILQQKLQALASRPYLAPRHTMQLVVWHLGMGTPTDVREWLNQP